VTAGRAWRVETLTRGTNSVVILLVAVCQCVAETPRPTAARFPYLPAPVIEELQARNCNVPGRKSGGFTRGEFVEQGRSDWAVLCTTKTSASLLIFPLGSREGVFALETRPKGFAKWSIRAVSREQLRAIRSTAPSPLSAFEDIEHQGITSSVEFGTPGACLYCYSGEYRTYYYHHDKWLTLMATIAN